MDKQTATRSFVALVALGAIAGAATSWATHLPFPGWAALVCFALVGVLLDSSTNRLTVGATGSTSFIIHMAAGLLFGATWAGAMVAVSTSTTELLARRAPLKAVFNVSQRVLAIILAIDVYQLLGGHVPPVYLASIDVGASAVRFDFILFPMFAATYFALNTAAVAKVVSLNTGRLFREVWLLNTRGSIGYDIAASAIAILVAYLFHRSELTLGFGPVGLIGIVIPVIVVRHVYGLYHKLQDSGRELLQLMVKAIEARDPYTSGHSVRVAALSKAIAHDLRLPFDMVERIYTAALLHDVGKIREEFAPLLRKAAKLTDEEAAVLQTHPVRSAELVGVITAFRGIVLDSVRSHHERWDGGGYPDRLSGTLIPLGARIIAVADTADAMTTDRPYRPAASGEMALQEIGLCRGTQFDPRLVDAALASVVFRALVSAPHESITTSTLQDLPAPLPSRRTSGWRTAIG
ncbi:MAG: HD-GYP domain-containing protein [Gemmatimonadales bacterium]